MEESKKPKKVKVNVVAPEQVQIRLNAVTEYKEDDFKLVRTKERIFVPTEEFLQGLHKVDTEMTKADSNMSYEPEEAV